MIKIFEEKDYVSEVRDSVKRGKLLIIGENVRKVLDKVNYPKDMVDNVSFEFSFNSDYYITTYTYDRGSIKFTFKDEEVGSVYFRIFVFSFLGLLFVNRLKGSYHQRVNEYKITNNEIENNELYETMKELNKLRYELAVALVNDNRNLFGKKIKRAVDRWNKVKM